MCISFLLYRYYIRLTPPLKHTLWKTHSSPTRTQQISLLLLHLHNTHIYIYTCKWHDTLSCHTRKTGLPHDIRISLFINKISLLFFSIFSFVFLFCRKIRPNICIYTFWGACGVVKMLRVNFIFAFWITYSKRDAVSVQWNLMINDTSALVFISVWHTKFVSLNHQICLHLDEEICGNYG